MTWWHLRSAGNLVVLKVSYVVLAIIPFISQYDPIINFFNIQIWLLSTLFFASLFLALANLIYDIACPVIVKRFPSANDLYKTMLDIKTISSNLYQDDNFDASLEHCRRAYQGASLERPWVRRICAAFYILASALFGIVFGYRAFLVLKLFIKSLCLHG